ncbi:hypothetical protein PIB30_074927, partial [Stylosanthes scabra]|nr:hypothetical protein [Stylosanthes scabra]
YISYIGAVYGDSPLHSRLMIANQEQEGAIYTDHLGDEQHQNQQYEELDLNATAKMRGSSTEHQMHDCSSEIKSHVHSSESQPLWYNKEITRARGKQSIREARTFYPSEFGAFVPDIGLRRPKSITDIPHSTFFIMAKSLPDLETACNLIYQIYIR